MVVFLDKTVYLLRSMIYVTSVKFESDINTELHLQWVKRTTIESVTCIGSVINIESATNIEPVINIESVINIEPVISIESVINIEPVINIESAINTELHQHLVEATIIESLGESSTLRQSDISIESATITELVTSIDSQTPTLTFRHQHWQSNTNIDI